MVRSLTVHSLGLVSALLFSTLAFAAAPDFAALENDNGAVVQPAQPALPSQPAEPEKPHHGHHGLRICKRAGWEAAQPTAEQTEKAKEIIQSVKSVVQQNREAIHAAKKGVFEAWKKHPISKEEVKAALHALHEAKKPVKEAILDARISILNLLSDQQRTAFDHAFIECVKAHHHHHQHPGADEIEN